MELALELRSLAESEGWIPPVVSLYADTRWIDQAQRERVRIFWGNARSRAAADGVSHAVLAPIDAQVEAIFRRGAGAPGVAIFAAANRFRMLGLPRGVGQIASWDERPALIPLAKVAAVAERALAVSLGAKASHLLDLYGPRLQAEVEIAHADFPGRHDRGGFSQANFARHIREHIRWELQEVGRALVAYFDREPCRVFIFGAPQLHGVFHALLPARVQSQAVFLEALDGDPEHAVREAVMRVEKLAERARSEATYLLERRIYEGAMASRNSVLGAQSVILALAEGRVHVLLLKDGFSCYGARCLRCGALDIKRMTGCSYCGGRVRLGELSEVIVRRAILAGARIEFMPSSGRHGGVGGIAALLRPARGTGWPVLGRENHFADFAVGR